jgi:hypothetical protein
MQRLSKSKRITTNDTDGTDEKSGPSPFASKTEQLRIQFLLLSVLNVLSVVDSFRCSPGPARLSLLGHLQENDVLTFFGKDPDFADLGLRDAS